MDSENDPKDAQDEGEDDAVDYQPQAAAAAAIEDDDLLIDDDPVAEGEELPVPPPEPSHENANALAFYPICRRLEMLWKLRRRKDMKKKPSDEERLQALLPAKGLAQLATPGPDGKPQSLFPLLRLLMPDRDASRSFLMKENAIAKAYGDAFNLPHTDKESLIKYRDPNRVQNTDSVGDISCVVQDVLQDRILSKTSDFTVGDINALLDDLTNLQAQARSSTGKKKVSELRVEWVKRLNPKKKVGKGLSALEHKWLVRIILQQMQFGLGWKRLLEWYNPHAIAVYSAHTSLSGICKILCQPDFSLPDSNKNNNGEELPKEGLASYLHTSKIPLQFGKAFHPLCSTRTSFLRCLDDISARHRDFAARSGKSSLSFQHPAFCAETKLDGERMILHLQRDGKLKIHSRQSVWYSKAYGPIIGPALRRATKRWNVDVIFDGEVLSWDSGREETVPFGSNKTVANLRRAYMKRHGLLQDIDLKNSDDEEERSYGRHFFNKASGEQDLAGEECWLQFVAFDVVYLDGPDAATLLEETVSPHLEELARPGPIIDLEAIERKKLLYRLIDEIEHEIEIVPTWVIRPNGSSALGKDYFSFEKPLTEFGHSVSNLDSLSWTLQFENVAQIDAKRRGSRSNEEISQYRAWAVNELYGKMVENLRMEGLMFKDLSTPYLVGEQSRSYAYWHKFKPDYHNGSVASDLDVVICGAYFASGLRHAGRPSSFLCACVDSEDDDKFFPLCKVNAGSMRFEVLNDLFNSTGFVFDKETETYDRGDKWFTEEDRGFIPDFVSSRNLISDEQSGWRPKKDVYPDMWIHPNDSRILTLNAGEIVFSDAFSAGITLRFPRVTALRDATDKSVSDIESEYNLFTIYQETLDSRSNDATESKEITLGSPSKFSSNTKCRFLTEEQLKESKRTKRKSSTRKQLFKVPTVNYTGACESQVLKGLVFTVLEGTYKFVETEVDLDEARSMGWLEKARGIKSSNDVRRLIQMHEGTVHITPSKNSFVVGGRKDDAKVLAHIQAIENARIRLQVRKGTAKTQQAERDIRTAESPGVLRWTFVFTMIYSKLAVQNGNSTSEPSSSTRQPTILDYLARPSQDGVTGIVSALCLEDIHSTGFLKRALDVTGQSRKRFKEDLNDERSWQQIALCQLEPSDRWAVASKYQSLWPYTKSAEPNSHIMILYTACLDDSEDTSTSNRIAAVLPLARVMGATVTSTLDRTVTHVLCELVTTEEVAFSKHLATDIFAEKSKGRHLLNRIRELDTEITLISPEWLRKRKWTSDRETQ